MKKAIFVLSLLLAFALLGSAAWASDMQPGGPPMGQGDHGGMRGGPGGGMMSASTDPEIQAVLDFSQLHNCKSRQRMTWFSFPYLLAQQK